MIAVICPMCGGDTMWRYPHLPWARSHVPEYAESQFVLVPIWDKKHQPSPVRGLTPCPDAIAHLDQWRSSR